MSTDLTKALSDVIAERARQVVAEHFVAAHDDHHVRGELAKAAAAYTVHSIVIADLRARGMDAASIEQVAAQGGLPKFWPWQRSWWKPTTQRRNLVKAAALLVAEIERLDRAEARAVQP